MGGVLAFLLFNLSPRTRSRATLALCGRYLVACWPAVERAGRVLIDRARLRGVIKLSKLPVAPYNIR